ncbi:bifunctional 4-hydroxy-2-oxoglutarate aldolase/2-dehydro-3-deoxy-phosphogluconate aldolase [Arthrobacter sp. zg-ZUI100]|uniref:bifunctional 4-hydroxy-2-oxoglutarate aldolase/2-dehydro-3-deoxy-phosphogluconate aldolase n=1 Tax=Arthrobacter jiangjiafuii TaxID=2817475 RepID=UPI001AED5EA7|nr:bifunctional 4-hydroxy-2-oxoglutarate aldolase/2-dehydro-3-deoxy-phosphogluconate aldolase [Arthrobacter jiangjiafuii]MBP3037765.1 bifunctional 4-hydroxy-2-oxoglutarate aldolase/2-dehydro-3-deoxy-phosphogluconate aldolase [Arthrobacter jiangjiafuii]
MAIPAATSEWRRVPMSSALVQTRIIATLRAGDTSGSDAVVDTLIGNGVRCLELTLTTPGALSAVERLASRVPDGVEVGLGTVMTPDQVHRAADAGARFVMAPNAAADVIHTARSCGIASYPGAMTPSEIHLAWRAGATAVKLFPGGILGTRYLAAVREPLPDIPLIPTGSVRCDEAADWLSAGAAAVGLGGALLGDAMNPGGDLAALAERTRRVCEAAALRT